MNKSVITVDFDWTLAGCDSDGFLYPINRVIDFIKKKHSEGFEIHIVTFRHPIDQKEVEDFCKDLEIPIVSIVCTSSQNKVPFLKKLSSTLHIDDSIEVCVLAYQEEIEVLLVDHVQNRYNKTAQYFNKI
jgi:hypothetical protein